MTSTELKAILLQGWYTEAVYNTLSPEDLRKHEVFIVSRTNCLHCNGTGKVVHNDSLYECSHGLSLEDRKLSNGRIL